MDFLLRALGLFLTLTAVLLSMGWATASLPFYAINFYWGQFFHRGFGKTCLLLLNIKVKWMGMENLPNPGVGAILAPNHESIVDIPLLSSLPIDFRWISKEQVGRIPFIGQAMQLMGCYFVKRNRSAHDLNIMKEVEDGLREGNVVVIFPEGTRTRNGELLPFKKGAFKCAQNSGAPLIPIAITGTYEIAPPGKCPKPGHFVTARIGKPFYVPATGSLEEFMEQYREILRKLLSEDRGPVYDSRP